MLAITASAERRADSDTGRGREQYEISSFMHTPTYVQNIVGLLEVDREKNNRYLDPSLKVPLAESA